ncbi:MAG: hypothetical protein ACYDC2_13610, partial [Solirubrobacteraceae bacterium]
MRVIERSMNGLWHPHEQRLLRAQDAVDHEELAECQRIAVQAPHPAIGEVAELTRGQVAQVLVALVHVIPDPVLDVTHRDAADLAVDLEDLGAPAVIFADGQAEAVG